MVGINTPVGGRRIVGDSNPHIISFYKRVQDGTVTPVTMREYLQNEGALLEQSGDNGYDHYRLVKDRFNESHSPFDFIFLSRTGFNGMMRFNRKGEWNIPSCKKPNRFAPAYITKVCNQVEAVGKVIRENDWEFCNRDFTETIRDAKRGDIIYCDPPYYGRYVDYYNGWVSPFVFHARQRKQVRPALA